MMSLESLVTTGAVPATVTVGPYNPVTGLLVLTPAAGMTASHADFEDAVELIGYLNTSQNPTVGTRSVEVVVYDEDTPSRWKLATTPPRSTSTIPTIRP
jgi:hypothetical protein